jgi:polar amino acid transport system substrate-binding protein
VSKRLSLVFFALIAAPGAACAAEERPLTANLSSGWSPPFAFYEGDESSRRSGAGLIHDWYAALEVELGLPIDLRVLPPSRMKLNEAKDDEELRCFNDPAWDSALMASQFDQVAEPHLVVEEALVGLSNAPLITGPEQLDGAVVGTVLGYRYPQMSALFASGRVRREDAPAESNMLEKQLAGRTDYAVLRVLSLRYLQQKDPRWKALRPSPWVVSRTPFHCKVRRGGRVSIEQLTAAQQRLLARGVMRDLLRRYGLESPPAGQ